MGGGIFLGQPSEAQRAIPPKHIPRQLLIKFRSPAAAGEVHGLSAASGTSAIQTFAAARSQLAERLGIRYERQLSGSGWRMVEFDAEIPADEALELARLNPAVEQAELNYALHLFSSPATAKRTVSQVLPPSSNDPGFSNQWALENTGQFGGMAGADLRAVAAWQMARSHQTIVVAVLDTGVDYTHPDLANRIWINSREVAGNGVDDDGNGYVDDVRGWNFASRSNDPMDDHYHGTHMAGAIAAEINNGLGMAGVTGAADVRIMPLKFFDTSAQGTIAAAVEALDYAARNGARLINISWGDTIYSQALFEAVQRCVSVGCLIVSAAGNSSADNDRMPVYPASFNSGAQALPAVISVAATDESDRMLNNSNYGATSVDLAAPGNFIYSTIPRSSYGYLSGTSSAAALVSGVAALIWSHHPSLTSIQVKGIIASSVRRTASAQGKTISGGVAHAQQAMAATPPYQANNTVTSVSAADYVSTMVAPDSIIAAFGAKLATRTEIAQSLPLPTSLAGSTVKINGKVAQLFAATPGQINLLVPPGLPIGSAEITVTAADGFHSSGTITIAAVQPSIFTTNQAGSGAPAAVWTLDGLSYFAVGHSDGTPVSMEAGSYLVMACTGLRHAPNTDGNSGNGVAESVQMSIGGAPALVLYAGAQGDYAGLDQVNVQVPMSLRGRGLVELVMTVAGKTANKVVIAVR
jgi:uncharacterized protein (TIGR03437 family)